MSFGRSLVRPVKEGPVVQYYFETNHSVVYTTERSRNNHERHVRGVRIVRTQVGDVPGL